LDHLIRAYECLCREHGFVQQNLLPELAPATRGQVNGILAGVTAALQTLIDEAQRLQHHDDVRVLTRIQSRAANVAATEQMFGFAVVALLQKFGLPDQTIIDGYIAANPRTDGHRNWASVISSYRGATIHEGYMDFDKKHDATDVLRICVHLKDVLARVIMKDIGYCGTYESVVARGYGPQAIHWSTGFGQPRSRNGWGFREREQARGAMRRGPLPAIRVAKFQDLTRGSACAQ
jgi:hypothetical protein